MDIFFFKFNSGDVVNIFADLGSLFLYANLRNSLLSDITISNSEKLNFLI